MIYSGGFFSGSDKESMRSIRSASEVELAETEFNFQDERLSEMLFRYKARNFPATLTEEEQGKWSLHCAKNLMDENSEYLNYNQFFSRLNELAQTNLNSNEQAILEDLKYYAESIIPYS